MPGAVDDACFRSGGSIGTRRTGQRARVVDEKRRPELRSEGRCADPADRELSVVDHRSLGEELEHARILPGLSWSTGTGRRPRRSREPPRAFRRARLSLALLRARRHLVAASEGQDVGEDRTGAKPQQRQHGDFNRRRESFPSPLQAQRPGGSKSLSTPGNLGPFRSGFDGSGLDGSFAPAAVAPAANSSASDAVVEVPSARTQS